MKIFYGVNGEGLGHVSRTLSVVDQLPDCDVHIFTYGAAYQFLKDAKYPHLHRIDGLLFSYRKQRVNYVRSLTKAGYFYLTGLGRNIERIKCAADRIDPDLFVSDFEPSLARAAHVCHRQLVSIDNQHRFVHCRMTELPPKLRAYACVAAYATRMMVPHPDRVVIATFHTDKQTSDCERITFTAGLLRQSVEHAPVSNGGFLLAYVRSSVSDVILRALEGANCEVRIYGVTDCATRRYYEKRGMRFFPISPAFVQDLASCDRLVGTAGNQLICEARYFQKPMLAIPEPGQYEQYINAWYLQHNGLGMQCHAEYLSPETIRRFIREGQTSSVGGTNGVHQVAQVIRSYK